MQNYKKRFRNAFELCMRKELHCKIAKTECQKKRERNPVKTPASFFMLIHFNTTMH